MHFPAATQNTVRCEQCEQWSMLHRPTEHTVKQRMRCWNGGTELNSNVGRSIKMYSEWRTSLVLVVYTSEPLIRPGLVEPAVSLALSQRTTNDLDEAAGKRPETPKYNTTSVMTRQVFTIIVIPENRLPCYVKTSVPNYKSVVMVEYCCINIFYFYNNKCWSNLQDDEYCQLEKCSCLLLRPKTLDELCFNHKAFWAFHW